MASEWAGQRGLCCNRDAVLRNFRQLVWRCLGVYDEFVEIAGVDGGVRNVDGPAVLHERLILAPRQPHHVGALGVLQADSPVHTVQARRGKRCCGKRCCPLIPDVRGLLGGDAALHGARAGRGRRGSQLSHFFIVAHRR
jgi:hypothetical protein